MIDGDAGHQVEKGNVVNAWQYVAGPVGIGVPVGVAAAAIPANASATDAAGSEPINIADNRAIDTRWQGEGGEATDSATTGGNHIKALPCGNEAFVEGTVQGAPQSHVARYSQHVVLAASGGAAQFGFDDATGAIGEVASNRQGACSAGPSGVDGAVVGYSASAHIDGAAALDRAGVGE